MQAGLAIPVREETDEFGSPAPVVQTGFIAGLHVADWRLMVERNNVDLSQSSEFDGEEAEMTNFARSARWFAGSFRPGVAYVSSDSFFDRVFDNMIVFSVGMGRSSIR